MKSAEITVGSQGQGMLEAMDITEKFGEECGLGKKEILRLRLLSEELRGLLNGITGDVKALFWLEREGKRFELHLKADISLSQEIRKQLLAVSTSGENDAAKGFMGKVRELIAISQLPKEFAGTGKTMLSLGVMSMGSPGGYRSGSFNWSLSKYRTEIESTHTNSSEAEAAWDELEKSIVANIADEVKVSIIGQTVEITIIKEF